MSEQNGAGTNGSSEGSATIEPKPASSRVPTVIIVGGGLAGLSAAVELSSHGARVTVIDSNSHAGGKMNVLEEGGFSFDMGPTIITLPQVFRGLIERSGRRPEDYCELVDLDPQWRCFFEDGEVINLRRDAERMALEMDKQFPGTDVGAGYRRFIEFSRRMFGLSEKVFFYKDLGAVTDLMKNPPSDPGLLGDVLAMRMHSTVGATIGKHIGEPHLAQLCEHFLQYVGSSPFMAPAILSLIAAAQVDNGCWYPLGPKGTAGGTRMIARTLESIAREQGVEFILGERVRRIIDKGGRAAGVQLDDGRTLHAHAVVSNCDVQRTYKDLIGTPAAREAQKAVAKKYKPACSGLVLYVGIKGTYEHLAHHNFLFSNNSHEEFDDIYKKGIPARDPTLYIAAPSKTDAGQAPVIDGEPGEALYVLIHTAALKPEHQWQLPDGSPGSLLESYRGVVIDKMKRMGMEDLEDRIVVERHLTPAGIERMYNAEGGAIYGLASHGRLAGGFKPKNRSRAMDKLYLAGGSANPGPGVPMVLMSGVTAARALLEDADVELIGEPTAAEPERMPAGSWRQGEDAARAEPVGS